VTSSQRHDRRPRGSGALKSDAPTPAPDHHRQPSGRPPVAKALPYGTPYLLGDPTAARHGLTELRRALAHAGVVAEAAVARPGSASAARRLAERALKGGARFLVAVGADPIAHGLVEALHAVGEPDRVLVLGLVGLGRQELAATFGLPDDPERAASHLLGDGVFLADLGRARWQGPDGTQRSGVFANTAELGYPAEVSSRLPRATRAGRAGRLAASVTALARSHSTPVRLTLDHTTVEFRLAGLVVANGQFTMGRMKVAPRALPDDGRMNVLAFEGQPLTIYARSRELYYGTHLPHPQIREYQSKLVEAATAEALTLALDGCRMPGGPPLSVDVLPGALRVKI
jgi:diacylglycerol kinase (ATP)